MFLSINAVPCSKSDQLFYVRYPSKSAVLCLIYFVVIFLLSFAAGSADHDVIWVFNVKNNEAENKEQQLNKDDKIP